jgi:hypothetical protein
MIRILLVFNLLMAAQFSNNRVITIYTTDGRNPEYLEQISTLEADQHGLKERDLIVKKEILNANNTGLFKNNCIKGNFTVTLTGKDGGEKFRSQKPVTLAHLYTIIDAMPMRREEMHSKKQ